MGTGEDRVTTLEAISVSALFAGALDISATATLMRLQGTTVKRLLQFVASGALGASAFNGGNRTAVFGLLCHFLIAAVAASVYYAFGLQLPILFEHPLLFGSLYGIAVHLVMSRIVVPLSKAPTREFSIKAFVAQLVVHIVCVGIPIAFTQSRFLQ